MKYYKINAEEKGIVTKFIKSKIPKIFKNEYIDYLLMVENVAFYICDVLIKGNIISKVDYDDATNDYSTIIKNINQDIFDLEDLEYLHNYEKIIEIIKKYHLQ